MRVSLQPIEQTVTSWPGVTASPHRFGGVEFQLGGMEIGHLHLNGMVDIPFNTKIHDQLIQEQKAEPHHLLHDTGWITFYVRAESDLEAAIWLFRLSYLFYAMRGRNRTVIGSQLDLNAELAALNLSQPLHTILDGLLSRR